MTERGREFIRQMAMRQEASDQAIGAFIGASLVGGSFTSIGIGVVWGTAPLTSLGLGGLQALGAELSIHALDRMSERGIRLAEVEATMLNGEVFPYFHNGVWKTGYYDATAKIFVGRVGDVITTVMDEVNRNYINNLKSAMP